MNFILATKEEILSQREFEVLELIACGYKNGQIALALEIRERTVRFHFENILDKLNVSSRTEAVSYAFRNRWIIY
ncbi:MAG: response regulator transcription factor [Anaerolineae bacterium]|nr:response regulator transcription factor [Anaerolineae bacterium]